MSSVVFLEGRFQVFVAVAEIPPHRSSIASDFGVRKLADALDHVPHAGLAARIEQPRDDPPHVAAKLHRQTVNFKVATPDDCGAESRRAREGSPPPHWMLRSRNMTVARPYPAI